MSPPRVAQDKIDAFGLENICAWITDGASMTALAQHLDVGFGRLHAWIAADLERSARVREARTMTAQRWDEAAERRLDEAIDTFELAKAKEIAQHYRWRASKIAPQQYGERVFNEHTIDDLRSMSREDAQREIDKLRANQGNPALTPPAEPDMP